MKYRAEIDGLRAIAVLPVILFHAGFELFSGGFVGVDIFFVISGYLITTILVADLEKSRFSIVDFYLRRARRILPALLFVILVCLPFAWFWMHPVQIKEFAQSLVAVSFFVSNFFFWRQSGYFADAAEEKPLLHTWSLAVEEQYYLLFPIFLMLMWKYGRNRVFWVTLGFAVISFALSEWGWRNKPSVNFYFSPMRAWELLAGSLAAFLVSKHGVKENNYFSLFGLVAVVFAIFFYDESTPFPSFYTLVPVVGVVLLILYAGRQTMAARLLSHKVFVGIGLISYSAYLWHQPVFAFARLRSLNEPSHQLMFALACLSLVLAALSWKYVEQPFRKKSAAAQSLGYSDKAVAFLSVAGLAGLISIGLLGQHTKVFESRVDPYVNEVLRSSSFVNPNSKYCHIGPSNNNFNHPVEGCASFLVNQKASVMFIGDSHSDSVAYSMQVKLKEAEVSSYSVAYSGCVGLSGFYKVERRCDDYNLSMIEYAKKIGVKTIVISSRFTVNLLGSRFDNGEGGVEKGQPVAMDVIEKRHENAGWESIARKLRVKEQYYSSIMRLLENFSVVVIDSVPEAGWHVPNYVIKLKMFGDQIVPTTSLKIYMARNKEIFEVFDRINHKGFYRVKVANVFCSEGTGRCALGDEDGVFYRDDDHLSLRGAEVLAPFAVGVILDSLGKM